jgi:hypothetical protein
MSYTELGNFLTCSTSLISLARSIRQKLPLPGSSWLRATFMKYLHNKHSTGSE